MKIYYDSRTGNVKRFVSKIEKVMNIRGIKDIEIIKIDDNIKVEEKSHLITYTTGFGQVPEKTKNFLDYSDNFKYIISISSSGNMNWGGIYAKACDVVYDNYKIPTLMKFELSGTTNEAEMYLDKVIYSKEM